MWERVAEKAIEQFPVAGLLAFVCWFFFRYIREQHKDHMSRLETRFDEQAKAVSSALRHQVETLKEVIGILRQERDDARRERDEWMKEAKRD